MDKNQLQKLQELVDEVNKHCYNYYVLGNPTISDAEFDILYDKLLEMPDLHSKPKLDGEILIWKLYENAYVRAYCDSYDTCIDIISNSILIGSLTHWHPDEDDMFDELYSLGKKGNILVLKKYLFGILGDGVFYMGEPNKYRFNKNKKWHWGKLTYLEQK